MAPAPVADPTADLDFGGATGAPEEPQAQASPNDKPFDDEPFDAGVEADENSDPKKYIEQLTGKLGQSLRTYTETQGQPDFDLEKFAINSLLSATHTSEMDGEDQKDIIKKVKTAGNNDESSQEPTDTENPEEDIDGLGGIEDLNGEDEPEEEVEENILEKQDNLFLKNPKRSSIFAPEGSEEAKFKHKIMEKLHETFNQDDKMSEPTVEPTVKPSVTPAVEPEVKPMIKPSRRNKPFLPSPNVQPRPKALSENFGNKDEFEFHEKYKEAQNNSKKQINIKGLSEMKDLIGDDSDRLNAIVSDIRKEIADLNIQNNTIAATDNKDTVWIFNVLNMDNKIYLEFNGTAK